MKICSMALFSRFVSFEVEFVFVFSPSSSSRQLLQRQASLAVLCCCSPPSQTLFCFKIPSKWKPCDVCLEKNHSSDTPRCRGFWWEGKVCSRTILRGRWGKTGRLVGLIFRLHYGGKDSIGCCKRVMQNSNPWRRYFLSPQSSFRHGITKGVFSDIGKLNHVFVEFWITWNHMAFIG